MAVITTKREKPDFAEVYEQEYSYVYNYIYMIKPAVLIAVCFPVDPPFPLLFLL